MRLPACSYVGKVTGMKWLWAISRQHIGGHNELSSLKDVRLLRKILLVFYDCHTIPFPSITFISGITNMPNL
jgi:hypothetical protein